MAGLRKDVELWELVRTVEVAPVIFESGDSLNFRIEIQKSLTAAKRFRARVFRIEFFELKPTFTRKKGTISSEEVVVHDESYLPHDVIGTSARAVLNETIAHLTRQFSFTVKGKM